jgi:MFS family permease
MAGINAVVYFSSTVFKAAGVTSDVLASAGVGLVNVLATVAAGAMLDKLGRKPLLMGSFAGMAACMLLLAVRACPALLARVEIALAVRRPRTPVLTVSSLTLYSL